MIVAVYGETDKRPVIYTLIKLFQRLGDCCLISDNRHYKRLLDTDTNTGHYQNVFITVTDASPDEVFSEIGYESIDFENMIFDNTIPDNADLIIFVQGCSISENESDTLEYLSSYETIGLGFGKNMIPYTVTMFKNVELIEGKKHLLEIDKKLTHKLATILSEHLNMSAKNICKVVAKK